MSHLFLIGYRGAGKTTVGRRVAEALERPFVDADELLQARAGRPIRQIFADSGEAAFRDLESQVIAELASKETDHVVALGGGAILREENRRAIASDVVVWLAVDEATVVARLAADPRTAGQRPPLTDRDPVEEVRELLRQRTPIYRQCADYTVDTGDRTPDQLCADIVQRLADRGRPED